MQQSSSPTGATVEAFHFEDDGRIPNHPYWPLLLYRKALPADAEAAERLFAQHGWGGAWRNGIYSYHHYHSVSHEVLGIVRGQARVQFGGASGAVVSVGPGDAAILPAGTGHKCLEASSDFLVVGAYPRGQEKWDLLKGAPGERPEALERIGRTPLPEADPVYGPGGPLSGHWRTASGREQQDLQSQSRL